MRLASGGGSREGRESMSHLGRTSAFGGREADGSRQPPKWSPAFPHSCALAHVLMEIYHYQGCIGDNLHVLTPKQSIKQQLKS